MRRLNHLTPLYVKNRLLAMLDHYKNPEQPWLTKDSIAILEQLIRESNIGFEIWIGTKY